MAATTAAARIAESSKICKFAFPWSCDPGPSNAFSSLCQGFAIGTGSRTRASLDFSGSSKGSWEVRPRQRRHSSSSSGGLYWERANSRHAECAATDGQPDKDGYEFSIASIKQGDVCVCLCIAPRWYGWGQSFQLLWSAAVAACDWG